MREKLFYIRSVYIYIDIDLLKYSLATLRSLILNIKAETLKIIYKRQIYLVTSSYRGVGSI